MYDIALGTKAESQAIPTFTNIASQIFSSFVCIYYKQETAQIVKILKVRHKF